MTLSLCHPVYSNIAAVWVCRDRWVYKVFLWKFWVDQSLSAVVLPLDTVCMCVSCVDCWLLSSQQLCVCLVLSFVLGHIGIWMLGWGGIHMCKWSFTSWYSHCACVHTLTPSHLLLHMCPPEGHPVLFAYACWWSSHTIPPVPHMERRGHTLFLLFTMETRHLLLHFL